MLTRATEHESAWEGFSRLQSISPDTGQQGDALVRKDGRITFVHVSGEADTGHALFFPFL